MTKLYKGLSLILFAIFISSCGNDASTNFSLKAKVKGLKKGIAYLQKEQDTSIVTLDSLVINGQSEFELQTDLEEPMMLYLKLQKNDGKEHYIPFFADKGITEISTSLKLFGFDDHIKGSKQQELLNEYLKVVKSYNDKNLELIEATVNAQKERDTTKIIKLVKQSEQLLKRSYSYTIQFALNNKNSEIAPYLALYKLPNANLVYVDSIYNGLAEHVKNSLYGKQLGELIVKSKSNQK